MKKPELILHIGSHKTGTTALQNSLHTNKDFLRYKGLYYGNYHNIMHHNLAFGLFKEALEEELINYPESHFYFTQIAENSNLVIDKIKKDVESSGEYTKIVISSEGLFGPGNFFAFHSGIKLNDKQQQKINENVIARLFSLLSGFDVKVVCYLRRQDLILESFYNQYCKGPDPDDMSPLPTFYEYWSTRPIVMDYFNEISSWARYFGKENVIVRPYEKNQLPLGVVYDFYINILGFTEEEFNELERIDAREENSRIGRDVLEYKRLLQIKGIDVEFVKVSNVLGDSNKNQSFLSQKEREKILDDCRESNRKLAIEFLSRNDGQLFYDIESKQMDAYEGLTLEKSMEITEKLINLFLLERKQLKEYVNNLAGQVTDLNNAYNAVVAERGNIVQERDALIAENESMRQEINTLLADRENIAKERDAVISEKESMRQEINTIVADRENFRQERDAVTAERESLRQERDTLVAERESLRQERDAVMAELHQVYGSKAWKITKPLRFLRRRLR